MFSDVSGPRGDVKHQMCKAKVSGVKQAAQKPELFLNI